jgi:hypothetical protein
LSPNYSFVTGSTANLAISRATVSVNADPKSKVYGSGDPALTYTLSGFKFSDNASNSGITGVGSCSRGSGENVATSPYTITCVPNTLTAPNYTFAAGSTANFAITKATLSVNADPKTKTYGDVDPALTYNLTGFRFSDNAGNSSITGTGSCSRTSGQSVSGSPYTITCVPGALTSPNYSFQTGTTANFTISRKVLSVNADSKTKTYGAGDPTFTYGFSGFASGENAGNVTITGAASCSRASGETVGGSPYTITCVPGTLSAANYSFQTGSTGSLTITKASSTTSVICPTSAVYTGSAQTPCSASVSGAGGLSQSLGVAYTNNIGPGVAGASANFAGDANHLASGDSKSFLIQYSSGPCLGSPGRQILQPINVDGSSIFKQGSTVPAKFRVCDAAGNSIGTPGLVTSFVLWRTISGTDDNTVNESVVSTTPDTAFRWDPTDKQWIFNINTKDLVKNKTYVYLITLNDTSTIEFRFGLK